VTFYDFIGRVAQRLGVSRSVAVEYTHIFVETLLDDTVRAADVSSAGEHAVSIPRLGTFRVSVYKGGARVIGGKQVKVPKRACLRFRASSHAKLIVK
jgi:nucleoid DNA-binding protein